MGEDGLRAGRRRRRREVTAKSYTVRPRFSVDEQAVLVEAAGRAGLTVGAWLGDVGVRVARGEVTPLPADWREVLAELAEDRAQIQRVGVLLNQLTAVAHRTGQLPDGLIAAAERLGLVRRLDDVSARAHRRLR